MRKFLSSFKHFIDLYKALWPKRLNEDKDFCYNFIQQILTLRREHFINNR